MFQRPGRLKQQNPGGTSVDSLTRRWACACPLKLEGIPVFDDHK